MCAFTTRRSVVSSGESLLSKKNARLRYQHIPAGIVVIVVSSKILREKLKILIELTQLRVVGVADAAESGWSIINKLSPDLVILCSNNLALARRIKKDNVNILTLLVKTKDVDSSPIVDSALRKSGSDFCLDGVVFEQHWSHFLLELVRVLTKTDVYQPRKLEIEASNFCQKVAQKVGLTLREKEVLRWMTFGKTNDEIALQLGLSPMTIKTHTKKIHEKLQARSRAEVVVIALRGGLVS